MQVVRFFERRTAQGEKCMRGFFFWKTDILPAKHSPMHTVKTKRRLIFLALFSLRQDQEHPLYNQLFQCHLNDANTSERFGSLN
jgi:hypothetical protein